MPRWLETDTLTDHDISSAHEVGSYTSDADRLILAQVFIDTAAGNGDYVFYATLQIAGAGSAYVLIPKTTAAAASGETAIGAQSIFVAMKDDDVLKIYADALAGDTSVDVYCRFFEMATLKPATADRTLNVDSNGYVVSASLGTQAKADVNAEVVDVIRTDTIPDSYSADGAQPTIAQAILAIQQYLQERSVSGTTVTVKKPDGSTTAMTFTLNDGSNPTSQTRAS